MRLRDPITVRSTSSELSTYYYYPFGFFWIIFYPFSIVKLSSFYLITSSVPTCLVHNCETSQRLFYSHLLSPLSRDQIPFDPHQRSLPLDGEPDPSSVPLLSTVHFSLLLLVFCVLLPSIFFALQFLPLFRLDAQAVLFLLALRAGPPSQHVFWLFQPRSTHHQSQKS